MRKTDTPAEHVQLTDDQWETIAETLGTDRLDALDQMKCQTIEEFMDLGCEMVVRSRVEGWRRELMRFPHFRDNSLFREVTARDQKTRDEIVKNIDRLTKSIDKLIHDQLDFSFLEPPLDIDGRRVEGREWQLRRDLKEFRSEITNRFGHLSPKKFPKNVDTIRDRVWESAAEVYERVTGKRATVTIATPASENEGQGSGKFLNFLRAVVSTIPGEPVPTGHQVNAVLRKFRSKTIASEPPKKGRSARY